MAESLSSANPSLRCSAVLLSRFAFREDDLVHHEEDHHRRAAVEDGGADIVDPVRHKFPGHRNPDTIHRVDDHRHDAESNHIPHDLIPNIALAAEDEVALDREIDCFTNDHGNHVCCEVAQSTVGGIVAKNVPLEGLAEERHIDARPTEVSFRQRDEQLGQELQNQILEHRHQVADDDEQSTLPDPLRGLGMLLLKIFPNVHPDDCHLSSKAWKLMNPVPR